MMKQFITDEALIKKKSGIVLKRCMYVATDTVSTFEQLDSTISR